MTPAPSVPAPQPAAWLLGLLAVCCGAIVANIYYSQPLVGPIAASIGLAAGASGLIVTVTQVGYGIGLLLIVPVADLVENRRLAVSLLVLTAAALAATAASVDAMSFLAAAFLVGLGSVVVQILVPYAAHLSPESRRGRNVGMVMSGLLAGIMLARPLASFLTQAAGWRAIFAVSAVAMGLLAAILARALPRRRPGPGGSYGALLRSMLDLLRTTPILRRRAAYQACLFGAFSLFWTVAPLRLASPVFGFTQRGIGLFALVGAAGAVTAPLAGRLADRGWSRPLTLAAILTVGSSFLATLGSTGAIGLALLVAAAVAIDIGVTMNLIVGQRAIFMLGAEVRSRLNGLYMAIFFAGGAFGSAVGVMAYATGGWPLAAGLGAGLAAAALVYHLGEYGR